jgi:hypothetical protein
LAENEKQQISFHPVGLYDASSMAVDPKSAENTLKESVSKLC